MRKTVMLSLFACAIFWTHLHAQTRSSGTENNATAQQGLAPKPAEWLSFRRSGTLEAHSPLRGKITQPSIAWKQFVGAMESRIVVERAVGKIQLTLTGEKAKASSASDSISLAEFFPVPANEEEDNSSTTSTYADILPEYPGKEKLEFESAFNKTMTNGQWALCVGRCFAKKNGEWITVWETEPLESLFQPLPIAGDFDSDGTKEIAILPFYKLLLLDARTGKIKDSRNFNDNRSYGFFGVYDFNKDGKTEFLVQADFSKHVDVLGFRDGKLDILWQREIEPDIAHPQKILRVAPDPVMDIDNDGQAEVVTTLFNDTGDGRWHLTFIDAITGKTKIDFPDEMFAAPVDIDGDGVKELLSTCAQGVGALAKIRVRSVKTGQPKMVWEKENVSWQTWDLPLPRHVKSLATLGQRTVLTHSGEKRPYVVLREVSAGGSTTLNVAQWNGSTFKVLSTVKGENLDVVGFDKSGRMLVKSIHAFGRSSQLTGTNAQVVRHTTKPTGIETGPAMVTWPDNASEATIVVQGVLQEQVVFNPPKSAGQEAKLRYVSGRGQGTWWPRTLGPVVADLAGDGKRQLIVVDAGPSGHGRVSAKDLQGQTIWQHEFPHIAGTPPPANTGGVVLWQTGHFTDARKQDVLVTTQRSKMHSEETWLLSGKDGRLLWHRDKQISKRAVGGNSFAIADYDGDGLDDIASLWPSILYLLKGTTGEDILAMDAEWKQVYDKEVYFGQAVAGDFLNEDKPSLFFSGNLMTGVIRLDGTLVWFDALDKSAAYLPSFGDFNGDGRSDAIGVGFEDGVRCYDLASGKVLWKMPHLSDGFGTFGRNTPMPVRGSASADVDSDGRDEALISVNKTLFCLGAPAEGSEGEIKWQVEFPAEIGPPTVVALDKDGTVSILVIAADGFVYCLR